MGESRPDPTETHEQILVRRVYSSIFIFYLNSPGPLTQRIHSLILPALEVTQSPVGQQDIDNITLLIHRSHPVALHLVGSQPTEPAPRPPKLAFL